MAIKGLRRDAAERREAILSAAELAFAEKGLDVPLEEICKAAGVGRATLYRNFENRIALVHAIMRENVSKLETIFHAVKQRPDGLWVFLEEVLRQQVRTGSLVYLIGTDPQLDHDLKERFTACLGRLLETALENSEARPGLTTDDLLIAVRMMQGGLDGTSFSERQSIAGAVFALSKAALTNKEN